MTSGRRSPIVFQTFHLMIAMWGLDGLLSRCIGFYLWKKKKLANAKWALWRLIVSVVLPPDCQPRPGWMTAEIGRQPWIVYGLLKTYRGGLPDDQSASQVVMSILMFIVIYFLLFALFIFLLDRKIKHGPEVGEEADAFTATPRKPPKGANS